MDKREKREKILKLSGALTGAKVAAILFPIPGIIGLGSVVAIAGSYFKTQYTHLGEHSSDLKAMQSDWNAVSGDIRVAFDKSKSKKIGTRRKVRTAQRRSSVTRN